MTFWFYVNITLFAKSREVRGLFPELPKIFGSFEMYEYLNEIFRTLQALRFVTAFLLNIVGYERFESWKGKSLIISSHANL